MNWTQTQLSLSYSDVYFVNAISRTGRDTRCVEYIKSAIVAHFYIFTSIISTIEMLHKIPLYKLTVDNDIDIDG